MKVAILHYWFLLNGGGEKVISALLQLYPDADVFCLMADKHSLPSGVRSDRVHCSFLQNIPFSRRMNRALFPLYPAAVASFDFSGYDLILSSDSPPTKAIVTPPETVHVSYCHTPGRYIWDLAPTFQAGLPMIARPLFGAMAAQARLSDYVAAQRVDRFIANSRYTQSRIWAYYRQESTVVYPPVETSSGYIADRPRDYYLSAGRLHAAKRIDLLVDTCNQMGRRLIIAGAGPEERNLKSIAGPTIEFAGRVSDDQLRDLYAHCRALLFAADEDFGIAPVEAQSCGRPVVAFGHGGSLETVRHDDPEGRPDTGIFFDQQTTASIKDGILRFEAREGAFDPGQIRQYASSFDSSVFRERLSACIDAVMARPSQGHSHEFAANHTRFISGHYLADDAAASLSISRR